MNDWIKCSDHMPSEHQIVWVWFFNSSWFAVYKNGIFYDQLKQELVGIKLWYPCLPPPQPPQESQP